MGAPRLDPKGQAQKLSNTLQALVTYNELPLLHDACGISLKTLQDMWRGKRSQPYATSLEALAEGLRKIKGVAIDNAQTYFFGDTEITAEPSTPLPVASQAVPKWIHDALDAAYRSEYRDFVHMVVTWAAKTQPPQDNPP